MTTSRTRTFRQRSRTVQAVFAIAALGLTVRLVVLQVISSADLSEKARKQHTSVIKLASRRGEILDRQGQELAISQDAWSVYAQPSEYEWPIETMVATLSPELGIDPSQLTRQLRQRHWHWLIRQRDASTSERVRAMKIPGIGVHRESRRVYPRGTLAANLIGFVGLDNQGLAGIEHDLERVLSQGNDTLLVQTNAHGQEILRENGGSPLASLRSERKRVVLTIDETLQHVAERELEHSIRELGALRGAVVMMDPRTGDVLAFALAPTFDPNRYREADWAHIKNWVAQDVYEPGSTMKIFTVAAALEAGAIGPNTTFPCGPTIRIGRHTISDHDAPAGIRHLTPAQILEVSSNVGALQVGLRMSGARHRQILSELGFGRTSGGGFGGESRGRLPALPWPTVRHTSISYGYGLSATALQVLTAATAIADDGRLHPPRLVDRLEDPHGKVLERFPVASPSLVFRPETANTVRKMLATVVETGTAVGAKIPGYHVAGKTGTANKANPGGAGYSGDVIASFLGFVPAERPELLVLCVLDSPRKAHYASMTAVPLFQAVTREAVRTLGIPPDDLREAPPS